MQTRFGSGAASPLALKMIQAFAAQGKSATINLNLLTEALDTLGWRVTDTVGLIRLTYDYMESRGSVFERFRADTDSDNFSPAISANDESSYRYLSREAAEAGRRKFQQRFDVGGGKKGPARPEVGKIYVGELGPVELVPMYSWMRHEYFLFEFKYVSMGVQGWTIQNKRGQTSVVTPALDRGKLPDVTSMKLTGFFTWAYKNGLAEDAKAFMEAGGAAAVDQVKRERELALRSLDNTGSCSVCMQNVKLTRGQAVMRHGWEVVSAGNWRGYGNWHGASCFGTGYLPFELSPIGTVEYRKYLLTSFKPNIERRIRQLETSDPVLHAGKRQIEPGHREYPAAKSQALKQAQGALRGIEVDLRTLDARIAGWSQAPLPGERQASRVAAQYMLRMGTKSKAEHEDAEARRLSRPVPTKKPPRKDLRRNKMQAPDKDLGGGGADGDKDLSLNYKRVARQYFASVLQAQGDRNLMSLIAAKRDKEDDKKGAGDYWEADAGWRAWPPGSISSVPARDEEHAKALAEGVVEDDEEEGGDEQEQDNPEKGEGEAAKDQPDPKEQARKDRERTRSRLERQNQNFDKNLDSVLDIISGEMAELLIDGLPAAGSSGYQAMLDAFAHHSSTLKEVFIHDDRGLTADAMQDASEVLSMFTDPGTGDESVEDTLKVQADRKKKMAEFLQGSPTEKGALLARLVFAQKVVANPSLVGGRALAGRTDPKELNERASAAARQYAKATPDIRAAAANNASDQLNKMAEDDPNRIELNAILDGIAVAAGAAGESLEVDGSRVRPRMAKSHQTLCKHLLKNGDEHILFGSLHDFYGPAGRTAVSKALDTMDDTDLAAFSKEGSFPDMAKMLSDKGTSEAQKVWIRAFLKRQGIETMTTAQTVIEAAAENKDAAEIEKRFNADLEADSEHQGWQEKLLGASASGSGVDYAEFEREYQTWLSQYYLDWLERMGIDPPKDDPDVARIRHISETGDTSVLDKVIVRQGEKPPTVARTKWPFLVNRR